MNFIIYLCLLLFMPGTDAIQKYKIVGKMLLNTCYDMASLYSFETDATLYYLLLCSYQPYLGTTLNCIYEYSEDYLHRNPEKSMHEAFKALEKSCRSYAGIEVNSTYLQTSYENATGYLVDYTSLKNETDPVYFPLRLNMTGVDNEYKAYFGFYDNLDMSTIYGAIILAYWGFVMFIASLANFLIKTKIIQLIKGRYVNLFRKHITIPTLLNLPRTRSVNGWGIFTSYIATRLEGLIILGYFIVHISVLCVRYYYDVHNIVFMSREIQVCRWIADRTGIIAFAHIPLIFLFGGRNNIFQWLTGFNYSSFIQFHKWTGRAMFANALIHGSAYTRMVIIYKGYATDMKEVYFQMGVVALIFCGMLMLQSLHFIRSNKYEIFLFTHIVFALLFLWSAWQHCLALGWLEWLYTTAAIWCFDRFIRLLRIISFGAPKAKLVMISEDTFQVSVPTNTSFYNHRSNPGQYVFIYFLTATMFWQSHPFTVMDSIHKDNEFTLYIKAKEGITSRMANFLKKQPEMKSEIRVSIEGPYGESSPTERYDNALLMAGGNGIPGPLDHAIKLARSGKQMGIQLVWITQTFLSMTWMSAELDLLKDSNIDIHIYLTREELPVIEENTSIETDSSNDGKKDEMTEINEKRTDTDDDDTISISKLKKYVQFHYGRPDLESLIKTTIKENGKLSTAIVTCGPDMFCGAVRTITADSLVEAEGRVDLFEELQTW